MSILEKKRMVMKDKGVFGVILAERLGGKSTLGGTLPGKTAMLTAGLFETGAGSAIAKAKELKNDLQVFRFDSLNEYFKMLEELKESDFDNIYIDGASGITEMIYRQADIKAAIKKNSWDGFREVADKVEEQILATKELAEIFNKNVFYTMSVAPEMDKLGNVLSLKPEQKGNATVKNMKAIFPVVVSLRPKFDDDGNQLDEPELVTKTDNIYSGRLDDILSTQNPGTLPADLSTVISLLRS